MHISGVRGETGVPAESAHRHGENVQIPHRQWRLLGIHHFSYQHYNKAVLDEKTLFKDLLYLLLLNSLLSSPQNNPYAKVAYLGATYSATLYKQPQVQHQITLFVKSFDLCPASPQSMLL